MIPKPLSEITENDLVDLIGKPEGKQIEFKASLPTGSTDDLKEFLKDISSMANAEGGDVIFGIEEGKDDDGNTVAVSVDGVAGYDSDKEILRLTQIILANISPRIIGSHIQEVRLENSNSAFIIRVPKSWIAPHVVDRAGHWRFYYRDSVGAHPMDITELREAFLLSDTLSQRLEEFRIGRLGKIASNSQFGKFSKAVLHIQPLSSASSDAQIDLSKVTNDPAKLLIWPIYKYDDFYGTGSTIRLNFDGVYGNHSNFPERGYIQVFRNGSIEMLDTSFVDDDENVKGIGIQRFEFATINATVRCLALLRDLEMMSPVSLHLTLLGVKDCKLKMRKPTHQMLSRLVFETSEAYAIEENDLLISGVLFPEDMFAEFDGLTIEVDDKQDYCEAFKKVSSVLQPIFDTIWNAAGSPRSRFYNSDGIWTGNIEP